MSLPTTINISTAGGTDNITLDVRDCGDYMEFMNYNIEFSFISVKTPENVTKNANVMYECDVKNDYLNIAESDLRYAYKTSTYTKTECDDKFALKGDTSDVDLSNYYTKSQCNSKYVKTSGDSLISGIVCIDTTKAPKRSGVLTITTTVDDTYLYGQAIFAPLMSDDNSLYLPVGKDFDTDCVANFGYKDMILD